MSASPAEDRAPSPALVGTTLLSPGDVIDGRYRIEAYLGGGGMASVYRATHVVLEQPVAIKVISPHVREVPGMAQRFLREARAATQLKSTHIARVTDVGMTPDGSPYMVMEYLEGRDLDTFIENKEDVDCEAAVDYVLQACEALAEVHGVGIIHRDLKPANLFLTSGADGLPCVKLIDFGISRLDSPLSPKDMAKLTNPETVMGSPRYMSPEQMESASKADERSDIYGLGAVLYELLTHKAPHEGETFLDIYAAAVAGDPVSPSEIRADVPKALDDVVLKALRPDPNGRYPDVAALAEALAPFGPDGSLARADVIARVLESSRARGAGAFAEGESVSTDEGSRVRRRVSSSAHALRRRRMKRGGLVAALVVLVAVAAFGRNFVTHAPETVRAMIAPPAAVEPPKSESAPPPLPPPVVEPTSVTQTTGAAQAAATAAAPTATATEESLPTPASAPAQASAVRAVAPTPRPAWNPPTTTQPASSPPPSPPSTPTADERKLFEDRK